MKLQTFDRYEKPKRATGNNPNDIVRIRYIPLPPEKRAAWERSMRILTGMLLEILKEEEDMNTWFKAENTKPLDNTEVLGAVLEDGILFHEIVVWDSRDSGEWTKASNESAVCDVRFWMALPQIPKLTKA